MLPVQVLELWLSGEQVDVVAPGLRPEQVCAQLPAGRRLLVVTPDDGTAMLVAARMGHAPLLRTTGAEDRSRLLARSLVVTSLDSLHIPTLRTLLVTELEGAARLLLGACRLDPRVPGNLGRASYVAELLGPSVLRVHSLRATAPEGAPVVVGEGAVVVRSGRPALDLAALGGGVTLSELDGLTAAAHDGGLVVREHDLRRPFARGWIGASVALAEASRGFDVVSGLAALPVSGAAPVYWAGTFRGGFVPDGSLFLDQVAGEVAAVDPKDVSRVLAQVEKDGGWSVFPGDDAPTAGLLEDLVAVGVLGRMRPAWSTARIADAKRFRSPFADREPAWKALADRYSEALRRWSLEERTRLALSDQSPRDLVELARALGTDLATLSDALMDLDAANVIAARTEARGGSSDIQVRRGRDFGASVEEATERVASLRARRRLLDEEIDAALQAPGCSTAAWRALATGVAGDPCGLCAHCEPTGEALRTRGFSRVTGAAPAQAGPRSSARQEARSSLQGLFGSLEGRAPKPEPEDPLSLARSGAPADLERAVELAGSAAALYVHGLYSHRPPGGQPALPLPEGVVQALLGAIESEATPTPASDIFEAAGASVRRARSGSWNVQCEQDGPGLWRFAPRSSAGSWESDALTRLEGLSPTLARLAAARRCQVAWIHATRSLEMRLGQWLERNDGVPGPAQLATLVGAPLPQAHPLWTQPFGRWQQLGVPASPEGHAFPTPLPAGLVGRRLIEVLSWLASLDEGALLAAGRALLVDVPPAGPIDRLLLRSLTILQPALSAEELARWLELPERPIQPGPLVERLSGGRRGTFAQLAGLLDEEARPLLLARAVTLGRVPRELLDEALAAAEDPAGIAAVLVGATPSPDRARRVWDAVRAGVAVDDHAALLEALQGLGGRNAAALAKVVGAEQAHRAELRAARAAVVELAQAGQLGQAATRLAALVGWEQESSEEERAAFEDLRTRAIERQRPLLGPIVAALAGSVAPGVDDAAFGALEDAVQEGFGAAVVALLARQHRRAPEDARRALWFARALALNGDWGEAQRVYRETAREHVDLRKRFETEFEGVFLAFDEGQGGRALAWLGELLSMPWHQILAPHVDGLVADDIVKPDQRGALADLLEGTGSPFYAKAVRRLRGG